jgi:tRNA A37 methylthiotransferase MiaB
MRTAFIAKNTGTTHEVLIEERKNGIWRGWTENYLQVELEGAYQRGQLISYTFD